MSQDVFKHLTSKQVQRTRARSFGASFERPLASFLPKKENKNLLSNAARVKLLTFSSSSPYSFSYSPVLSRDANDGYIPLDTSSRANLWESVTDYDLQHANEPLVGNYYISTEALGDGLNRSPFTINPEKRRSLSDISYVPIPHKEHSNWPVHCSSQAIVTTSNTTFSIWSANDYFCLLFGYAGSQLNRHSVFDIFPKSFSSHLSNLIVSFPIDNEHERILFCGDVFPVITVDGVRLMDFWVKEKQGKLIWILEFVEESYIDIKLQDGVAVDERTEQPLTSDLLPSRLPKTWDQRLYLTTKTTEGYYCPSMIYPLSKSSFQYIIFHYAAGLLFINSDFKIISLNEALFESMLGYSDLLTKDISLIFPDFKLVLQQLADSHALDPGRVVSEIHVRHAYRTCTADKMKKADYPYLIHSDGNIIQIDCQIISVSPHSVKSNEPAFGVWLIFDSVDNRASDFVRSMRSSVILEEVVISDESEEEEDLSADEDYVDSEWEVVPHNIASYTTIKELGIGAYGQVKLATYKSNKVHEVILKSISKSRILLDSWMRDKDLGTVPMEISILHFLKAHSHPNIVKMITFFEDNENYYLLTEPQKPGIDLFDYIELKPSISEKESKAIFFQIALAVAHLHSFDIIHRDIKDENVILEGNGCARLIDFGSSSLTKNGPFDTFRGTVGFAAPELLRGEKYLGKEQDIWALGILLYTIVYRENPYYNIEEILDAKLRIPFELSKDNVDLICRMLDRNVHDRITIEETLQHHWFDDIRYLDTSHIRIPLSS
ncbi:Serine/threonine-protein kinase ppk6 [Schizosaccharomyces pombe]|uniref:Serine/threonine-protein kinase ppk6 n=1 Tax=Schizosaccharomyces pombe (strain 972 / ATCC 24843) TaxID=284812 RepID=PPK6_SCHPO|nr:putative serine/threonine protein kinase Ppk6 [Schizosaccharomyces pombe]Q9UTH3.2 RecName: Full=Serine/threonine-protein kinase ppk6 [Schizosaccharomyces pombe 972h-]CAB75990.2 serine/threonine protein kinase Ppk6 (predicted) [Schizosaccharomyces pombe]|eukprot:NP_001342943.1 putative serine/threonine protein kinase Ppk6 [Schizosaccharomyces pombe]